MNKIKIEIIGKNPDYFLKEIIKKKINIYDLEKNYKSIRLVINIDDYEIIKKIKTTYKIKVIEKYGVLKLYDYLRKYNLFLLLIIIGILINLLLSNIVFNIEVIHPNKKLVKIVYKDLNDLGLKKYHFKVNKNKIKEKLLEKEKNRIEWLEIENIGTKYIIKLEEKKHNKKENKCRERNIISKKEALIYSIESSSGEIVKKKNDYVSKGEVIISGLIHNKDKIVSKRCAIGKVYGETWYTIKVLIPTNFKTTKELKNKDYGMNVKIFKKNINLGNRLRYYKKYVYNIIDSKIIPISMGITKYQEIKENKIIYNLNNVDEISLSTAEKEIKKKLTNDEEVISKKVLKKIKKNSKIEVEVFIKVKEDITSYQDITDVNIEELNEKEE